MPQEHEPISQIDLDQMYKPTRDGIPETIHPWNTMDDVTTMTFFNGKSFQDGLKDYNEFHEKHDSAVGDTQPEPPVLSFFNGRPYADGLKAYNEHVASKGAK